MLKKLVLKYRYLIILSINLLIIALSYYLAFYTHFNFIFPAAFVSNFIKTIPLLVLIKMLIFYRFGLFSGLWRYVSFDDLYRIIKATIFATFAFFVSVRLVFTDLTFPGSIFFLDWVFCFFFVCGTRFITRFLRERFKPEISGSKKRALIIGAGEAGIMALRECQNNPQ